MKKVLLVLLLLLPVITNGQDWQWMKGAKNGQSKGVSVATDQDENVYSACTIWGNGYFGASPFSNFCSMGNLAIVKYDKNGNLIWLKCANSCKGSYPIGLTTDRFGNEYIIGVYGDSTFTFGDKTITRPTSGTTTLGPVDGYYFVGKINSVGNVVWLKNLGNACHCGGIANDGTNNIATDVCGDVYVTSWFCNNPIIGTDTLLNEGWTDILVAKLDTSGSPIWAKSFGGRWPDLPQSIKIDTTGNIYIAGSYKSDTLKFGSFSLTDTTTTTTAGLPDWSVFLTKLDNTGSPIWAKTNKGGAGCYVYGGGLAIDQQDNVFLTGYYGIPTYKSPQVAYFDSYVLPAAMPFTFNSFLTKFDNLGNVSWVKCSRGVIGICAATDPCQNIWVYGTFFDDSTIADSIDGHYVIKPTVSTSSAGPFNQPTYLAGWTNSGVNISIGTLQTGDGGTLVGLTSGGDGSLYITGRSSLDTFQLGGDYLYNEPTGGGYRGHPLNMFTAKYRTSLGCLFPPIPQTVCNSDNLKIEAIVSKNDINIYPNPASAAIMITSTETIYRISITDILGHAIYNYECNNEKVQVDLSHLPEGVYVAKINGIDVRRFIKLNLTN